MDVFSGIRRNSKKTVNAWNLKSHNFVDVFFLNNFFTVPFSALFENCQSVKQLFFFGFRVSIREKLQQESLVFVSRARKRWGNPKVAHAIECQECKKNNAISTDCYRGSNGFLFRSRVLVLYTGSLDLYIILFTCIIISMDLCDRNY